MERSVLQDDRRDFRSHVAKPVCGGRFFFWLSPANAGGDIVQLTTIVAVDRLNFAVNAGICAAGKLGAILAPRALELKRPAHFLSNTNRAESWQW